MPFKIACVFCSQTIDLLICSPFVSNILIAGGSGLIGTDLRNHLEAEGHKVSVLSRTPDPANSHEFRWDIASNYIDPEAFYDLDVLINLNGANLMDKRWTEARKKVLRSSRIGATALLVNHIIQHNVKLNHFINASAIGYYGDCGSLKVDEDSPTGSDFLAKLCQDWENEALRLKGYCPVSIGRIGLYLHPEGGVYKKFSTFAKYFILSSFGNGKQYLGYTHRDEYKRFIASLIEGKLDAGIYNITGIDALTMNEFVHGIVENERRKIILPPIPAVLLKLILGESAIALLYSQRVQSTKLQKVSFHAYSNFKQAIAHLTQNMH